MSIHGYMSKGKWQDTLSTSLQDLEIKSAPYKYGVKIFRILPHHINNDVNNFRDWYFSVVKDPHNDLKISQPFHRPSIIAHSLGTWILAKTLTKFPEVKFDKIYLVGSIIPADFDWFKLILADQVNSVVYEKTDKDWVVHWGFIFTGSLRPCGRNGFIQKSSFIMEEQLSLFGHSDFNYKEHIEEYLNKRLPKPPHQLAVLHGRDLDEKKIRKLFRETERIDHLIYNEEYTQNVISIEKAVGWFRIEKDIWSFVVNSYNNSVLGYINAVPVNDVVYKKFCSGEITETEINQLDILDYDVCRSFNLIILSVAIEKTRLNEDTRLTKGRIAEMLIMSFIYKINKHNNGKSKLGKFAAFAWTHEGTKLCEGFCMKRNERLNSHALYEICIRELNQKIIAEGNFMAKWWYTELLR